MNRATVWVVKVQVKEKNEVRVIQRITVNVVKIDWMTHPSPLFRITASFSVFKANFTDPQND